MAKVLALAVLCFVPLADSSEQPEPVFEVPLDAKGETKMYWTLDYSRERVQFEIHVTLASSQWFAVGFSDYGEMTDADLCVLWVDWRGTHYMQDAWTDGTGRIDVDRKQDCEDFDYTRKRNVTKFTFSRQFDTCDDDDYILEDGTTHIIWAKGRGPLFRLAGLDVTKEENGMQRTQLLKNIAPPAPHPPETWPIEIRADRVHVPGDETTYWCHVQKLPPELKDKHHVVQFEAVIQKGNEGLVHHMEVFHCEADPAQEMPAYRGPCFAPERPEATSVCKRVLSAWAMGATPFVYPEEAGLPIGGKNFNPYVMLEVHYNNPQKKSDWVDSSGVRIYVTKNLRQFDGGVIELGLEYTDKMAIPPKQSSFTLSGYCISECTAVGIPAEGIVIFGSQLHTHLTGFRVITRHVRDGKELPELNRDNHYSTHFQEIRILKRPVRVLPGDALITTCWHQTEDRQNVTLGGFAISDEMCVNYVHYYPKAELEVCKSSISSEMLHTYFRFLHDWEDQDTSADKVISENYKSIEWTPLQSAVLHDVYEQSPLSMQCNQSTGERFPGYWENLPLTMVPYPLPPPERTCPHRHHNHERHHAAHQGNNDDVEGAVEEGEVDHTMDQQEDEMKAGKRAMGKKRNILLHPHVMQDKAKTN